MLARLGLAALLAVSLAACEPKTEEPALDGAPELDGGPKAAPDAPGELDGSGAPAPNAGLSAVMGIVPPMGVRVIETCETVIAADYTSPPKMTCLLFQTEDAEAGKLDAGVFVAISEAGWSQVRSLDNEYYFERPRAGTDCAEVAVVSVLTDRLQAVVDHAGGGKPAARAQWQGYAIPASTREACGADRMGK
jgi:hypothetical protein